MKKKNNNERIGGEKKRAILEQATVKPIRAAIYCRVSTYEQAQGEFSSLDGQESYLTEHCKNKGWTVYKIYRDTKSGKSLDRVEIQKLLSDAEDRCFDVMVATKLDRVSRSVKDFLDLDSRLNALGIDIVITTQQIDTTTPMGKMQRVIMLVFAEFEREMISARTTEKLYAQAQKGYWSGGPTPLGYDAKEKKLIVNDDEAKIVKRIFSLYADGTSSLKIANLLNNEGYKNKVRKSKGNIISDKYTQDSILRILKNKLYIGLITIKRKKLDGKTLPSPVIETFKGLQSAIMDEKTFDFVQTKLHDSKKNKYSEYKGSPLLLLQKIKCGTCDSMMTTTFTSKEDGKKVYGYKCKEKAKKGNSYCPSQDIPAIAMENFVFSLVQKIGSSEKLFDAVFEHFILNDDSGEIELKEKLEELQKNLKNVEIESTRLINIIKRNEVLKDLSLISNELTNLDEKKKFILVEIDKVEDELRKHNDRSVSKEEMRELFGNISELFKELDKDEKRKLIDFIINEIRWYLKKGEKEGEIEIFFRGDGHIKKNWVRKANPSDIVSSLCLEWYPQ